MNAKRTLVIVIVILCIANIAQMLVFDDFNKKYKIEKIEFELKNPERFVTGYKYGLLDAMSAMNRTKDMSKRDKDSITLEIKTRAEKLNISLDE